MDEDDEVNNNEEVESDAEESGQTLVFGIPVEDVDANIQPLDVLVLVKGINMDTGSPMMITVGSGGIPIWEIIGMLDMELERLKYMAVSVSYPLLDEDQEEE